MSSEEDINADPLPESPPRHSKDNALFEPKSQPKIIRVLTVFAYILSVSMAAILLSIYYIFMWNEQKYYQISNEPALSTFMDSSVYDVDNFTIESVENTSDLVFQREMQQQYTGIQEDELLPTASSSEEITTSPDYDSSSENDFGRTSTFIKKLTYKYPYAEND